MAGHRAGAVALAQAMAVPALNGALVALALADAHDVDLVASGEHVSLQDVANVHGADVGQTELAQGLLGGHVGLIEVALGGLVHLLGGNFAVAQLHSLVAVALHGLLLHHGAGAGFDHGDGNDPTALVEQLSHAQLLADDTFDHVCKSSC